MDIKNLIASQLKDQIKAKFNIEVELALTIPPEQKFGDYSTNVAFGLAPKLGKSPIDIATDISNTIKSDIISRIEVVKPGFINIFINQDTFVLDVIKDNLLPIDYSISQNKDLKVIVEHTSVNPNKSMHIGHLRNSVLGDSIARLLKKAGYQVEVQNYIDDLGLQVADTTNAYLNLGEVFDESKELFDNFCWNIYSKINKLYETDESLKQKRLEILDAIEKGDNEISKTSNYIVNKIVECQLNELNELGIKYDLLVSESDIMKFNLWEIAFEKLRVSPHFVYETEGKNANCWVLKNNGDGGDKVFVRSNGTKVYTAKDTVYHLWKYNLIDFDFKYKKSEVKGLSYDLYQTSTDGVAMPNKFGNADLIVNLIDERQTYPQEMVKLCLSILGYQKQVENYHHIGYGTVNLSKDTAEMLGVDVSDGAESYAMSGRKGIGVKTKDLLSLISKTIKSEKIGDKEYDDNKIIQITNAAIKFYMLKNHHLSPVIFDYKEATNLNGATGPYIQYSYARAKSILGKLDKTILPIQDLSDYKVNNYEYELAKHIDEWKGVFYNASKTYTVSYISEYALKLCSLFNSFYHANPVLDSDINTLSFRVNLINAYLNILSENMYILGIDSIEQM